MTRRDLIEWVQRVSLRSAAREQGLDGLVGRLAEIVPDLGDQYTMLALNSAFVRLKVRQQHAFQVSLALRAIDLALAGGGPADRPFTVADIGDSAGTHIRYLQALTADHGQVGQGRSDWLSVNLDPVAIDKIRAKGLRAMLCRAEDLHISEGINADLFLSFEMLEHLTDPVRFLDALSSSAPGQWLALTVPYLTQSRVGLHHIRLDQRRRVTAENTHIFELAPSDWRLLFQHAGWRVVEERLYLQYPKKSLWRLAQPLWKREDFEGFYGAILQRDRSWAACYAGNDTQDTIGVAPT